MICKTIGTVPMKLSRIQVLAKKSIQQKNRKPNVASGLYLYQVFS